MLGYLTRDYTKGLVYDGTNLNDVLDGQASLKFKKENPDFKTFTIPNLYGKQYTFKFPAYDLKREEVEAPKSGWKNITLDRYEKVIELSNLGYINDYTLGAHKALTESFDIFVKTTGGEELYTLIKKDIALAQEELINAMTDEEKEAATINISKLKRRTSDMDGQLIMMKEEMMAYTRPDNLLFRPSPSAQEHAFQIGQDYDFHFDKYDLDVTVKDNYTAALRYAMLNKALEEWNANPKYKFHQRSTLNQWWQSDVCKRMGRKTVVLAPRRCIHEDTPVKLQNGAYKKAKDITKNDVLFGDKHILSLDHNKLPSYKITLQNGLELIVSENHRVPTSYNYDNIKGWDLNEDNYKLPAQLKEGDFLPVNFSKPKHKSHGGNMGFISGFIYGMAMGDGDRTNHTITIKQDAVLEHFQKRVNPNRFPYTIRRNGNVHISKANKFIFESPELQEYSYNKYIPWERFAYDDEWKWGVVEGMIITDGYLCKNKPGIEYCSASKRLAQDFQLLLLDLGVFSILKEKRIKTQFNSSTNNIAYCVYVYDNESLKAIIENTDLSCKKNYKTFYDFVINKDCHSSIKNVIPLHAFKQHTEKGYMISTTTWRTRRVFGDEQLREPLYNFQRNKCKIFGLQGWLKYFWVPIKSIEKLEGEYPVVDFEVDGDHTFVANGIQTHNSGKSFLLSQEILKELLAHNYKQASRPRSVIFLSKDFDAVGQVMDYVNAITNDFDWLKKMLNYDATNHILSLITYDKHGKKQVLSQCKFYSALGKLPAVGDAADAVIIDEALLIPKRIVDKIMPIVDNELARLLVISTFYSEDEEGVDRIYDWPVKLCNEYEKESSKIIDIDEHIIKLWKDRERTGFVPDECAGLRYTIDDVEVIVNKDQVKESLADDPERYMRELYCRSSESKTVLNYKPYIAQVYHKSGPNPYYYTKQGDEEKILTPKFKRIVTAYDPAQTSDISAFLACGYDEKRNKICVIKEWGLNFKDKSSYIPQAKLIKDALAELEIFKSPILKVADSNHPGVIDAMWGQRVFFQYLYVWGGGNDIRKGARPSETRVPKHLMVEAAQMLFDNGMVEIWSGECKMLIEQLDNFVEFKNEYTQRSKFQSSRGHDDFVDTLLYCLWTFWEHLGLSHNKFTIDESVERGMNIRDEKDPYNLRGPVITQPKYDGIDNAFWY